MYFSITGDPHFETQLNIPCNNKRTLYLVKDISSEEKKEKEHLAIN